MTIEQHIFNLLQHSNNVIVPSFGEFFIREESARYDPSTKQLLAPKKEVDFRAIVSQQANNNFETYLATTENISIDEAQRQIDSEIQRWKDQLSYEKKVVLPSLGVISINNDYELTFTAVTIDYNTGLKGIDTKKKLSQEKGSSQLVLWIILGLLVAGLVGGMIYYFNYLKKTNEIENLSKDELLPNQINESADAWIEESLISEDSLQSLQENDSIVSPLPATTKEKESKKKNENESSATVKSTEETKVEKPTTKKEDKKESTTTASSTGSTQSKEKKTEEVKSEKPKTTNKPAASTKIYNYQLIAGSFKSLSSAEKKQKELVKEGHKKAQVLGKLDDFYIVSYETFPTENEAQKAYKELRDEDEDVWFRVKE